MLPLILADQLSVWEFDAFRIAIFIIFMVGLYRLVRREIGK